VGMVLFEKVKFFVSKILNLFWKSMVTCPEIRMRERP
jgi:hypothetical protein